MTLRTLLGSTLVAALLTGCAAQAPDDVAETAQAARSCLDPPCTVPNGVGVYTEEYGYAGFGASQIMITHFINNSYGGVSFDARYFDNANQWWQFLPSRGQVQSADYYGTNYSVVSVNETGTVPTWTMQDTHGHQLSTQTPADFLQLVLHLSIADPNGGPKLYELSFNGTGVFGANKVNIRKFNMLWRAEGTQKWTQYCLDAAGNNDQVVFQQTIAVSPMNGAVTRNASTANVVTLSCLLGAPALVHSWGYPYRPGYAGTPLFDGGIHMKRASYCGDSNFYTKEGTQIGISDVNGIENNATSTSVEAWWLPGRAYCYDPSHLRHPEMGFDGHCADGTTIPVCTGMPQPPSGMWLEDSSSAPQL